jgi:Tol biopolymer transport system component
VVKQTPTTRTNSGSLTVVIIDLATGRIHTISPVSLPFGTSFSPDGSQLGYTRSASAKPPQDEIYLTPAAGGGPSRLTHGGHSSSPLWGRNRIAFVRESAPSPQDRIPKQDIYLAKPSGAGLHRLMHVTIPNQMFGYTPIAWSANGRRLIAEFDGIATN